MIIKLLEQPVIAINEALIVGHVRGVVLEDTRVTGVYAMVDNVFFTVPLDKATLGPDAVMIADVSEANMIMLPAAVLDSMTEVFNHQGVHMGSLIAVETDEEHLVTNLYTERCEFPYAKVTKNGDVIMADIAEYEVKINDSVEHEAEKLRNEVDAYIDYNVAKAYKTVAPIINESIDEDASNVGFETSKPEPEKPEIAQKEAVDELKTTLRSVQEFTRHEEPVPAGSVDKKYQYLCGKKLLGDVEINGSTFEKGSIIDAELIKCAIESNAIVKVIMNAED